MKKVILTLILALTVLASKADNVTADNFIGYFDWHGKQQLAGSSSHSMIRISVNKEQPERLTVSGLNSYKALDAYFDPQTQRLIIPDQIIGYNDYYNVDVKFTNWTVKISDAHEDNSDKKYEFVSDPDYPFFFTLTSEGVIRAGDVNTEKLENFEYTDLELAQLYCVAGVSLDNDSEAELLSLITDIEGTAVLPFEFTEEEWNYEGMARFHDAWFPNLWDNWTTPTYEIPLYSHIDNSQRLLLRNPYGPETPYAGLNMSDREGYLIFDISNPDCVIFEPLVYSATIDVSGENNTDTTEEIFSFNLEGYYKQTGVSDEEIIYALQMWEKDISVFDRNDNRVNIFNPEISLSLDYYNLTFWNGYEGYSGYVIIPETTGVERLDSNPISTEEVYYDLSGIKIDNPGKGIYIKCENGKFIKVLRQ